MPFNIDKLIYQTNSTYQTSYLKITKKTMMQFWIGDSQEYLAVEYAKSNRSTCRQCKQKIAKDQLRIGLLTDSDQMPLSLWHHLNCFHFKPRHKALQHEEMIEMVNGIEDLDSQDCDKVLAYLEQELKNFLQNKYTKKPKSKKSKKPKNDDDSDSESNNEVKKQKAIKKTKTDDKEKEQKTKKFNKTKSKKQEQKTFLSSEKEKLYQEYYEKYVALTANELKEILHKNNQPKTGTKDTLAEMCADGKLLGRIPNCPKCAGGKLRFDLSKGTYKCPGYMEDTEFKHCKAVFSSEQIKRLEWLE